MGLLKREGPQKERIEKAENTGERANAHGYAGSSQEGEDRLPMQKADRKSKVIQGVPQNKSPDIVRIRCSGFSSPVALCTSVKLEVDVENAEISCWRGGLPEHHSVGVGHASRSPA